MTLLSRKLDVSFDLELTLWRRLLEFLGLSSGWPEEPSPKAAAYLALLAGAYGPLPPAPFREEPPLVRALTFDASGLAALARGDVRARAYLARAVGSLARIVVPSTSLVEPRLGPVADAVAEIVELDESLARSAARIMTDARGDVPLDALVVACAAREHSSGIVTSDRGGIAELVRAADRPGLHVFPV